jgi:hypothetical protein
MSSSSSFRSIVLVSTAIVSLIGGFYIQDIAIERYRTERDAKIKAIVDDEERKQEMKIAAEQKKIQEKS